MAYKLDFEIKQAIPILQNTFDSGIKKDWWEGDRSKSRRNWIYLKAAADDKNL